MVCTETSSRRFAVDTLLLAVRKSGRKMWVCWKTIQDHISCFKNIEQTPWSEAYTGLFCFLCLFAFRMKKDCDRLRFLCKVEPHSWSWKFFCQVWSVRSVLHLSVPENFKTWTCQSACLDWHKTRHFPQFSHSLIEAPQDGDRWSTPMCYPPPDCVNFRTWGVHVEPVLSVISLR